jgi:hypothetical protein
VHAIAVSAAVPLQSAIVLATQDEWEYPCARWATDWGGAEVRLVVDSGACRGLWGQVKHRTNVWVNTKVTHLEVLVRMNDVSEDEWQRLVMAHPSAPIRQRDGRQYQENETLGERVADRIALSANGAIRLVRDLGGQFWLTAVALDDNVGGLVEKWGLQWTEEGKDDWKCFDTCVSGHTTRWHMHVGDRYLRVEDWVRYTDGLRSHGEPAAGYGLLAEAKARFEQKEAQIAVIHLSSAVEWGTQAYLEEELTQKGLPAELRKTILAQSHGRLLREWVLPLYRAGGRETPQFWEDLSRLQKLRADAGHPTVDKGLGALTDSEFSRLSLSAQRFLVEIVGLEPAKSPPPMDGDSATSSVKAAV